VCAFDEDGGVSCVVPPKAGEPCTPPQYVCASGTTCQITGNVGTCVPRVGVGEPCSDQPGGALCFDPYIESYCDETMHCRAFLPASYGEPCGVLEGGVGYECVGWGSCEYAATPVCVPPASDGALCDEQQGLFCLPPARCVDHICLFPSLALCGP
jgi:hypothetical protein